MVFLTVFWVEASSGLQEVGFVTTLVMGLLGMGLCAPSLGREEPMVRCLNFW